MAEVGRRAGVKTPAIPQSEAHCWCRPFDVADARTECSPLSERTMNPPTGDQGWWFRGAMDQPPEAGKFFELPAGGTVAAELSCNKGQTSWNNGSEEFACYSPKPLHTDAIFDAPPTPDVAGCAIALAYESDPTKVSPNDLTIISTNRTCPWWKDTTFNIPSDLPPCPPGGCIAVWAWIHRFGPTNGDAWQMVSQSLFLLPSVGLTSFPPEQYLTFFRAKVTGSTNLAPLPKPRLMTKCVGAPGHCMRGPKML